MLKKGHEYTDFLVDNFSEIADSVSHPFEDVEDKTIRISQKAIEKAKKIKREST